MNLSPANALLYFTFVDDIQDDTLLDEYRRMLPTDELERLSKFRFDEHKKRYLVGRALLRTTLAQCVGIEPGLITLARGAHGRPFLSRSQQVDYLQFNLSYTDGLVAVVMISDKQVGVDIENTSRQIECLDIARSYFTQAEYQELKLLSEPRRSIRFFEFWTQKEAYMKARGLGLEIALDEVNLAPSNTTTESGFIFTRDDYHWQFSLLNPTDNHKAAVCIGAASKSWIEIKCRKTVPLVSDDDLILPVERS